jgi:hypothetical protein
MARINNSYKKLKELMPKEEEIKEWKIFYYLY